MGQIIVKFLFRLLMIAFFLLGEYSLTCLKDDNPLNRVPASVVCQQVLDVPFGQTATWSLGHKEYPEYLGNEEDFVFDTLGIVKAICE